MAKIVSLDDYRKGSEQRLHDEIFNIDLSISELLLVADQLEDKYNQICEQLYDLDDHRRSLKAKLEAGF